MTETESTEPISDLLGLEPIPGSNPGGSLAPMTDGALEHIDTWRARLSDQVVVSASEVQNRLFDLYGDLEPFPQLDMIKPWLSLTVQRELFSSEELQTFLDELAMELRGSQTT